MPSPAGHALGGLAAGWLIAGVRGAAADLGRWPWRWPAALQRQVVLFGVLGMLPDIDFLFGTHSTYTHSLGASLTVALAAAALARGDRLRQALACGAAYATHVLFDWMGSDTTPPIGIMALWPWTDGFYQSDLHVFMAISRRYWLPGFWTHNLEAVVREVIGVGLVVAAVAFLRRRRTQ